MAGITELIRLTPKGFEYGDYPSILAWYQDQYRAIYGKDIVITPDSQDGQWLAIQAKAVFDLAQSMSALYNSLSPSTASEDALRRNVKINGITPKTESSSILLCLITGTPFTKADGIIVKDSSGNKWKIPVGTIIGSDGRAQSRLTAIEPGQIALPVAGNLSIDTPVYGVNVVQSLGRGFVGTSKETTEELRNRQQDSTMLGSAGILNGMIGAVKALGGVTRVKTYENASDTPGTIPAHTICLVIQGGDDDQIASVLAAKKVPGGPMYGGVVKTVTESWGTSEVAFSRPVETRIKVKVTIKPRGNWITANTTLIKYAVSRLVNGFEGDADVSPIEPMEIGEDIVFSKFYGPTLDPMKNTGRDIANSYELIDVGIAKEGDPYGKANLDLNYVNLPVCDPGDVEIVVVTSK